MENEREREREEQECCLVCDCKQQAVLSAVLPDNVNTLFRCLSLSRDAGASVFPLSSLLLTQGVEAQ